MRIGLLILLEERHSMILWISLLCTTALTNFNHNGLVHTSTQETFDDSQLHSGNFALAHCRSHQVPHLFANVYVFKTSQT